MNINCQKLIQRISILICANGRKSVISFLFDNAVDAASAIAFQLGGEVQVGPIVFVVWCELVQVYVYHISQSKECLYLHGPPLRSIADISASNRRGVVLWQCDNKHHLLTALLILLRKRDSDAVRAARTGYALDDSVARTHERRGKPRKRESRFGQSAHSECAGVVVPDECRGRKEGA